MKDNKIPNPNSIFPIPNIDTIIYIFCAVAAGFVRRNIGQIKFAHAEIIEPVVCVAPADCEVVIINKIALNFTILNHADSRFAECVFPAVVAAT